MREHLLLAHANNLIDDEDYLLLYDVNKSKNRDFPYWSYTHFDLERLNDDECYSEFRFARNDIYRLKEVFHFPESFTCYNGTVYDSVEALCIFLKRFAYPCRYLDILPRFGRPVPQLCMISNHLMNILYESWHHLLGNLQQNWLATNNLEVFADVIHQAGAPLTNCWGFVDGTVRPITRPKRNQRIVYNGHKRVHGIKFQSVVTPNGLIANLFGPVEGKRHDSGMLADSGLLQQLRRYCVNANGDPLSIYGDPAYPFSVHLLTGFKGANITQQQGIWNQKMSKVRTSVEWVFGDIINYFKFLDFKKNLKLGLSAVGKMYIVCALLHNARCCLYGSETSTYFQCDPPIIETYFT